MEDGGGGDGEREKPSRGIVSCAVGGWASTLPQILV
jgi:hypothetical protein